MFLGILELRVHNTNGILDKTGFILWSQIFEKKMAEKWPLKTLKNIAKKYKKHEIVHNLWRISRP